MGELDEAMCEAIALGERAGKQGDVPVGAVVLDERGTVIGRGRNRREAGHDPLAHAEIEAMREAAQARGDWNLADCTLVVTLEPCPMCAGACIQTHIGRIVFGAWDAKLGACGSIWDIPAIRMSGMCRRSRRRREAACARLLTASSPHDDNCRTGMRVISFLAQETRDTWQ